MARNLFAQKSTGRNLLATPEVRETAPAGEVVPQDDPYFLPSENGQIMPDALGGPKGVTEFSPSESAIGALETGLSLATGSTTGMVAGALGGLTGAIGDLAGILTPEEAQELQQRAASMGTYEPKTEAGRRQVEALGELTESLPPITGSPTPRVRVGKEPSLRKIPEAEARAVRFSEQTGAPLMATDIAPPQTFAGKAIRGVSEKVPIAGTGGARAKQKEARQRVTGEYIESFDQVTDQDLYNSLLKAKDKKSQAMSKRYENVGNQMGETPVPASKTIATIDSEIADLQKPGKVQSPEVVKALETLKEQLESGEVGYNDMRNNRTLIRETLKSDESRTISDRVIDRVYKSMTDDIQSTVEGTLGPDAARKLKQADRVLFEQYNEAKKTKLKNVLNKGEVKPEEVTKMLLSNDKSEVKKLYRELDSSGRDNARSLLIGELKKIYDETESPEKVLLKAKKLGNQFDTFFRGEQRETYLDLVSYLKQTKQAANAGVYNQNGQQLMTAITIAPIADLATGGVVATSSAAALGVMGRLLESRKVRGALRKLKGIRPYTPDYNQALIALDNAVSEVEDTNE